MSATSRLTTPDDELLLALGDDEADELAEGAMLPDALLLGVGSPVGPGEEDTVDELGGRPTVGDAVTSTTCGDGAPCTGAAPDVDGEPLADGAAPDGPTVTVMTGPGV